MAAFNHTITHSVQPTGATPIVTTGTYTAASSVRLNETAPDVTTTQLTIALDVSAVKSFFVVSDKAVTLKTNSSGAPDNTLVLVANVPYIWNTDAYDTFKLTVDVASIFVVNASGGTATVQLEALVDPTP